MEFFGSLLVIGGAYLIVGLSNMLTINMLHYYWWDFIPTISYGESLMVMLFPFLFAIMWRFIGELIKGSK